MYTYIHTYVYIYIYIYIEREREVDIHVYIYIYIYTIAAPVARAVIEAAGALPFRGLPPDSGQFTAPRAACGATSHTRNLLGWLRLGWLKIVSITLA